LRLDFGRGRTAGVFTATPFEATDGAYRHVVIAQYLAAQSHARQATRRQQVLLRDGYLVWLARHELDAARRTASVSPARVQLIDASFARQR